MTRVLIRNTDTRREDTGAQRKGNAKPEMGVMWSQVREAEEYQQPREAKEAKKRFSHRDSRGSEALMITLILDSQTPELWENKFCCFKSHPVCDNLLWQS